MENQNNKDNQKGKPSLPPLLSGSEYKSKDTDSHREANLLGCALAIVVQAQKDNLTMPQKNDYLSSFEAEVTKVVTYRKNAREFYRRHNQKYKSPDTGNEDFFQNIILKWLKASLTGNACDWDGLYKLIKIQVLMFKSGPTDWWKEVQSVCKRVKTTVDTFDPITEILRITKEYHAENEAVRQNETGDNDTETVPAETKQKDEGSKIMITAKTSKENWEAIRSEYDISKNDFGKKIKFVSDSFKKKIIFRDIEHAFVLASQGFSKPALILAGGVIEELLRQYLEHKNIKLKNKRFVDYIKACEDNGLLKRGVYRLSDSIRDFRNLVHLDNEKTKRHTISKATAKGAVSSIFTIANDFR